MNHLRQKKFRYLLLGLYLAIDSFCRMGSFSLDCHAEVLQKVEQVEIQPEVQVNLQLEPQIETHPLLEEQWEQQESDVQEADVHETDVKESDVQASDVQESDVQASDIQAPDIQESDILENVVSQQDVQTAIECAAFYEQQVIPSPTCGSIGGEWTIIGLARCNRLPDSMKQNYLINLKNKLASCNGILSTKKYTEYSRVILALSSINVDASQFDYPLLTNLGYYDKVTWQGANGAAFALLALDSRKYKVPTLETEGETQTSRQNLVDFLVAARLPNGGWSISGSYADPDVTAMVLTALAPYQNVYVGVTDAIAEGIKVLSDMQLENGGFASSGIENSESISQVLVALSTLGISINDPRFIKNGNTVLNQLLSYQNANGSFCHVFKDSGNAMATEQALYALVAYYRFTNGQTSLYDMTDVMKEGNDLSPTMTEEEFITRCLKISDTPVIGDMQEIDFLLEEAKQQDDFVQKDFLLQRLLSGKNYIENTKQVIEVLDQNIWNNVDPLRVKQSNEKCIQDLYSSFMSLQEADRIYVKYAEDLKNAYTIIEGFSQKKIVKKVFENVSKTKEEFCYKGTIKKGITYTITIRAEDIVKPKDMDARIKLNLSNKKSEYNISEPVLPNGALAFTLLHSGKLPAVCKISITGLAENGLYELHDLTAHKDSIKENVQSKKKTISFNVERGGSYYLIKKTDETYKSDDKQNHTMKTHNTGVRNQNITEIDKNTDTCIQDKDKNNLLNQNKKKHKITEGIFTSSQLLNVKGLNKNLSYSKAVEKDNQYAYRGAINGLDIKGVVDGNIDLKLQFQGDYDKEIAKLCINPFYIYINPMNEAIMMYFEIECNVQDGEYMLCQFVPDNMSASYLKKVSVKDKTLKMTIPKGGIYFISDSVSKDVIQVDKRDVVSIETKLEDKACDYEIADDTANKEILRKETFEIVKNEPIIYNYLALYTVIIIISIWLLVKRRKSQN